MTSAARRPQSPAYRNDGIIDPSGGKASYWLDKAASALDCAVQCCGTLDSHEIDVMESRCDELAAKLREVGR